MSILWCGGEDLDFPNGAGITSDQTAGHFRSAYSRCDIRAAGSNGSLSWSNPLAGGQVSSCWLSTQLEYNNSGITGARMIGLMLASTADGHGLWICTGSSSSARAAICTFDGTTLTQLAVGSFDIWPSNTVIQGKLDMQLISYGASATVNVYWNGAFYCSYSGNVVVGSLSGVDSVGLNGIMANSVGYSEILVTNEDTRSMSLMTMAPTGLGTTDSWTGPYTSVNPVVINDTNTVYTNTAAQDEQFNITDLPAGTFGIQVVKVIARASKASSSTPTQISLGFNNGGTVAVATAHALSSAFGTIEDFFALNPVTSAAWLQSDMNALQLDLRSS
jgi:hypothetical protein